MVAEYRRLFGGRVGLPQSYTSSLQHTVAALRDEVHLVDRPWASIQPPPQPAQMLLPLAS